MIKAPAPTADWREDRRRSAREAIVVAAWATVEQEGLAGLSLRDLARRAGITTPTVYAYFDSKNAIYDAMFGQAAEQFYDHMSALGLTGDARTDLCAELRRFAEYCTSNIARYQLLFQRTIPGFEPSPQSYAHAIATLDRVRERLGALGFTEARQLDLWTAMGTGLVDQQISNDPGGDRWLRLIEDSVDMFLAHFPRETPPKRKRANR